VSRERTAQELHLYPNILWDEKCLQNQWRRLRTSISYFDAEDGVYISANKQCLHHGRHAFDLFGIAEMSRSQTFPPKTDTNALQHVASKCEQVEFAYPV
jgi:hypothetical protein